MSPRTISVIALGGTIASTSNGRGGVAPNLTADALLESVPGLDAVGVEIRASTFRALPSSSLGLADLAALAELVEAEGRDGRDGVVITQGTDTLEETAYYLDLTTRPGIPVVVTGAMRNPTLAGADGPANVLAAVTVAASEFTTGAGTVVVFNDEVHAARHVRKTHTTSTATFQSPDAGPIGLVSEGVVRMTANPVAGPALRVPRRPAPANVAVLSTWLGDDGGLLAGVAGHYQGLVLAGLGGGHVHAELVEPLGALAATMPVILASRTGAGPILHATYDFPGSELDLLRRGLVSAGSLHPYKARILLHLLLAAGTDRAAIRQVFAEL